MGHMVLLTRCQLLNSGLFERARHISCGNIASKRLRCLFFTAVITENDCSHRQMVMNGTMTSNAFLTKLGNCARQQHQNLPAGMSMNKAFPTDEFWRSSRNNQHLFESPRRTSGQTLPYSKGCAVPPLRNPGLQAAGQASAHGPRPAANSHAPP